MLLGDDSFYWFTIYAAPANDIYKMSKDEVLEYNVATQVIKSMPTRIDSPYFFVNEDGGFYKDTKKFNRAWIKAHKKKQIRYRIPYCCRHTRAAELLSKGILPGKCAQQLGHSLAVFYNTYAEMIDEYQTDRDLSQFEPLPETEHKRI